MIGKLGILALCVVPALGQGKPVPDSCPASERVVLGDGNYAMFCKPSEDADVNAYLIATRWNYKSAQGRGWVQTSDHWMLEVYAIKYKAAPPTLASFRNTNFKGTVIGESGQGNELTAVVIDLRGRRLYIRCRIKGNFLVVAIVTTFCDKNACDPDRVGFPRLESVFREE